MTPPVSSDRRAAPAGPEPASGRTPGPEVGVLAHLKWSLAMVLGTIAVAALAIPLLRLLGFMDGSP